MYKQATPEYGRVIDPMQEATTMAGWFPDYLFEGIDAPAELPTFTKARLRRHFGDDIEAGLRLVCDELPMLPADTQADVAAYICGYPNGDLDALLSTDAAEIVKLLDERFPPLAQPAQSQPQPAAGQLQSSAASEAEYLSWQDDALCAQVDPELFFPERGGSTRNAKGVCLSCEVRDDCLEYSLTNGESFGMWGGLSERQRKKLKARGSTS